MHRNLNMMHLILSCVQGHWGVERGKYVLKRARTILKAVLHVGATYPFIYYKNQTWKPKWYCPSHFTINTSMIRFSTKRISKINRHRNHYSRFNHLFAKQHRWTLLKTFYIRTSKNKFKELPYLIKKIWNIIFWKWF